MSCTPWRALLTRALYRNRSLPHARYLQLATIRNDGKPANRTVVFRGFLEGSDRLQFVTDTRSEKAQQIAHHPWGEICWYFPKTREQFRISGNLILVREKHPETSLLKARLIAWQQLSDAARQQFAWPHPGAPRASKKLFRCHSQPSFTEPLSNFCLLLLEPQQVDFLELRGEPQNRYIYRLESDGTWVMQTVNP